MTITQLGQDLSAGRIQPVYAIVGENMPVRSQALGMLRESVCPGDLAVWNVQEVDGSQAVGSVVATIASTAPFLGERRLIIVHAFEAMPLSEQETLLTALPSTESVVVLVANSIDKRTKAGQTVVAKAAVVAANEPKADAIVPWLLDYVRQQGLSIERAAAQALIGIAGNNTGFLAQEIGKFAAYLGGKGTVTEQLVLTLAARGEIEPEQYAVFRLTEAIVEGKPPVALAQLEDLLAAGEPPLRILAMIARQYRLMFAAKAWQEEGVAAAARALNMKTYPVERLFGQSRRFSVDDLEKSMRRILDADLAIKYSAEPAGALQMLVVDLCTAKENARR